ncbi:unnamed protein product, partial [Amoebophrya sp. A120]
SVEAPSSTVDKIRAGGASTVHKASDARSPAPPHQEEPIEQEQSSSSTRRTQYEADHTAFLVSGQPYFTTASARSSVEDNDNEHQAERETKVNKRGAKGGSGATIASSEGLSGSAPSPWHKTLLGRPNDGKGRASLRAVDAQTRNRNRSNGYKYRPGVDAASAFAAVHESEKTGPATCSSASSENEQKNEEPSNTTSRPSIESAHDTTNKGGRGRQASASSVSGHQSPPASSIFERNGTAAKNWNAGRGKGVSSRHLELELQTEVPQHLKEVNRVEGGLLTANEDGASSIIANKCSAGSASSCTTSRSAGLVHEKNHKMKMSGAQLAQHAVAPGAAASSRHFVPADGDMIIGAVDKSSSKQADKFRVDHHYHHQNLFAGRQNEGTKTQTTVREDEQKPTDSKENPATCGHLSTATQEGEQHPRRGRPTVVTNNYGQSGFAPSSGELELGHGTRSSGTTSSTSSLLGTAPPVEVQEHFGGEVEHREINRSYNLVGPPFAGAGRNSAALSVVPQQSKHPHDHRHDPMGRVVSSSRGPPRSAIMHSIKNYSNDVQPLMAAPVVVLEQIHNKPSACTDNKPNILSHNMLVQPNSSSYGNRADVDPAPVLEDGDETPPPPPFPPPHDGSDELCSQDDHDQQPFGGVDQHSVVLRPSCRPPAPLSHLHQHEWEQQVGAPRAQHHHPALHFAHQNHHAMAAHSAPPSHHMYPQATTDGWAPSKLGFFTTAPRQHVNHIHPEHHHQATYDPNQSKMASTADLDVYTMFASPRGPYDPGRHPMQQFHHMEQHPSHSLYTAGVYQHHGASGSSASVPPHHHAAHRHLHEHGLNSLAATGLPLVSPPGAGNQIHHLAPP